MMMDWKKGNIYTRKVNFEIFDYLKVSRIKIDFKKQEKNPSERFIFSDKLTRDPNNELYRLVAEALQNWKNNQMDFPMSISQRIEILR